MMDAPTAAYTAANPDVTFEVENRPGGAEGDNWSGRALPRERLGTSCNTTRASFFRR